MIAACLYRWLDTSNELPASVAADAYRLVLIARSMHILVLALRGRSAVSDPVASSVVTRALVMLEQLPACSTLEFHHLRAEVVGAGALRAWATQMAGTLWTGRA